MTKHSAEFIKGYEKGVHDMEKRAIDALVDYSVLEFDASELIAEMKGRKNEL